MDKKTLPTPTFTRDIIEELKKVTWPSKETAIRYSAYVIGISVAVAALIGVLDWIFTLGLEKFIAWLQ